MLIHYIQYGGTHSSCFEIIKLRKTDKATLRSHCSMLNVDSSLSNWTLLTAMLHEARIPSSSLSNRALPIAWTAVKRDPDRGVRNARFGTANGVERVKGELTASHPRRNTSTNDRTVEDSRSSPLSPRERLFPPREPFARPDVYLRAIVESWRTPGWKLLAAT